VKEFLANLRHLLASPAPPPAETRPAVEARPPAESVRRPTEDRPPPPALPEPASVDVRPAAEDAPDDVSEVRELLEAVAEAPVIAPEPEVEIPPRAVEPEPLFPQTSTEPAVDVPSSEEAADLPMETPSATTGGVGDVLVLTLGTPAATFTVAKAAATIGRGQENTIRLDDLSVSRRHARIAYRQGGYWLSDLGSMGGTWIGGTRLNAPRRIAAGEVIDIGHCRLTASFAAGAAKTDTAKGASKLRSEMAAQYRRRR
jgi:hypothetical protein